MSLVPILAVAFFLGICLVPVVLLRRAGGRASDYFVASHPIPLAVVRNSAIAYALRIVILGPLFVWGANGELWPAVIAAVCFGLGVSLIAVLGRPILQFLRDALDREQPATIHAFIARRYGGDPRVRALAASLTVFSLLGLVAAEAFAAASLLSPFMFDQPAAVFAGMFVLLLLMALYALPSGNAGAMFAAQTLTGVIYLGLFGSAALLLYFLASDLRPVPPHGTLAVLFLVGFCLAILRYRRTKYVDTGFPALTQTYLAHTATAIFKKILHVFNASTSVFAVVIVVIALMEFYVWGVSGLMRNGAAALSTGTRISALALIGIALLALLYPVVDPTNWQHIAVVVKNEAQTGAEPTIVSDSLREMLRRQAIESPALWVFMAMFGAVAVVATETPAGPNVVQDFAEQLMLFDNEISHAILTLLLLSLFAIVLSTMSSAFSAVLCTLRYDVLPALRPCLASGMDAKTEAVATRRTVLIGLALAFAMAAAFGALGVSFQMRLNSDLFIGLVVGFLVVQLTLAPLVIGALLNRTATASADPKIALLILGLTALAAIGGVAICLVSAPTKGFF